MIKLSEQDLSSDEKNANPYSSLIMYNDDISLNLTIQAAESHHIFNELSNLLNASEHRGIVNLRSQLLKKFINTLFSVHHISIQYKHDLIKELYIIYQIANLFEYYNYTYFKLNRHQFRFKILYPNMLYILIRFFYRTHTYLTKQIRIMFLEFSDKSYLLVDRFDRSVYVDKEIIKSEILCSLLCLGLRKFNPLEIKGMTAFYRQIIRQLFQYYFSRKNITTTYDSFLAVEETISRKQVIPARLCFYRDVLYKMQMEKICHDSELLSQIKYNLTIFKNIIVDNEIQNMYFSSRQDNMIINCNEYKLITIYRDIENRTQFIREIEKLPIIFKLLKSIHIMNPKNKPYARITPQQVKDTVMEELMAPFKCLFSQHYIYDVLQKVGINFSDNLLSGEYINLSTLASVKIDTPSFFIQLKKFIFLCLTKTNHKSI